MRSHTREPRPVARGAAQERRLSRGERKARRTVDGVRERGQGRLGYPPWRGGEDPWPGAEAGPDLDGQEATAAYEPLSWCLVSATSGEKGCSVLTLREQRVDSVLPADGG